MIAEKTCPVCSANTLENLKTYTYTKSGGRNPAAKRLIKYYFDLFQDKDTATADVNMVKCGNCGFIFSNPRLTEQDLVKKYAAVAEGDKARRSGLPPHLAERRKRVAGIVQRHLTAEGKTESARILDQGGAEGYLLSPLIDLGHEGYVIDYVNYDKEDPRIQYLGKTGELIQESISFDFIFLFHVLEHVADPVGMIKGLGGKLAKGGTIYIEVPLGAWMEWSHLREPLTHINFFSEQSLAKAAKQAGLSVHKIYSDWQYTTHPEKTPCINMLLKASDDVNDVAVKTTTEQMSPFSQFWPAIRANGIFHGKNMFKSLFE
jgi:hypothetical protein